MLAPQTACGGPLSGSNFREVTQKHHQSWYARMKKNSFHYATSAFLIISVLLSGYTRMSKKEELSLIDIIFFFISSIFFAASLTLSSKNSIENALYKIFYTLIMGLISSFIYLVSFQFSFNKLSIGESGMIFHGVFGILGPIIVGSIAILVSLFIVFRKPWNGYVRSSHTIYCFTPIYD